MEDNFSNVKVIKERLRRWQAGECGLLWEEAIAAQVVKVKRGRKRKGATEKDQPSL